MIDILFTDAAIRDANKHENMYKRNTGSYSFLYVFFQHDYCLLFEQLSLGISISTFPSISANLEKIMRVMIIYIIV